MTKLRTKTDRIVKRKIKKSKISKSYQICIQVVFKMTIKIAKKVIKRTPTVEVEKNRRLTTGCFVEVN